MSINITNLINQIQTKILDSDVSGLDRQKINRLGLLVQGHGGVLEYQFRGDLPTVDSSYIGRIAYVRDVRGYDDGGNFGSFYVGSNDSDGWSLLATTADSDELANMYKANAVPVEIIPFVYQGELYGYSTGGQPNRQQIDKFSFVSDGNSTNHGNLTTRTWRAAGGVVSRDHGYIPGGRQYGPAVPAQISTIQKFAFAVDDINTDAGDLPIAIEALSGHSSGEDGYTGGGLTGSYVNKIYKFPFAATITSTEHGTLTVASGYMSGASSTTDGYSSGGPYSPTSPGRQIDKFSFASGGAATDQGDITYQPRWKIAGQSSETHGYNAGGHWPNIGFSTIIEKFPFASTANATDVGDLVLGRSGASGQSSTVNGYASAGETPANTATINKFSFASDGNATLVGYLSTSYFDTAGQHN